MAEEQTGQERTEQPTERRLQQARDKGQVPRSRELNTMLSLLFAATGLWLLGDALVTDLFAATKASLSPDPDLAEAAERLPVHLMQMIFAVLLALAPFFCLTMLAALAGPIAMGGWSFSTQAIAPRWDKLDPIKGLGRLFSAKSLLELLKALVKFFLLLAVAYALLIAFEREILHLSRFTIGAATDRATQLLLISLMVLSATMLLVVVFDVPFELWNFKRQLRMTRQEVKEEMKETDGRPEVKQRIRSLQREMSQRRMMQDVPTADVVITNPVHYSVALKYQQGGGAPEVVAKGRDLVALQIQKVALRHSVPLFEAPLLARALHATTDIGQEIPKDLYLAVAKVLAYLFQLRRSQPTDYVPRPEQLDIPSSYEELMEAGRAEDAADTGASDG